MLYMIRTIKTHTDKDLFFQTAQGVDEDFEAEDIQSMKDIIETLPPFVKKQIYLQLTEDLKQIKESLKGTPYEV